MKREPNHTDAHSDAGLLRYTPSLEAGCDEAGRGALAGPVAAAAVILPRNFRYAHYINDSKRLTPKKRNLARRIIQEQALAYSIQLISPKVIDAINILQASILAMQMAIDGLSLKPEILLIDGNRFAPMGNLKYRCMIGGDAHYLSIAAASILAKTERDRIMLELSDLYPLYGWEKNKGYPTPQHRLALNQFGPTPLHRLSFAPSRGTKRNSSL